MPDEISFDPLELTADASLNGVVVRDPRFFGVAGLTAEQMCSRDAFHTLATDFGLTGLRPDRLVDDLARALVSADLRTAQAAEAVLDAFGHRLGALIATLRDPSTPEHEAKTPARQAFLSHWLTIDTIWLAGGLLTGQCGHTIVEAAQTVAAGATRPCRVAMAPYPALAPLLGAALRSPEAKPGKVIAVADLGHTAIKTAIAIHDGEQLKVLRLLKSRTAPAGGTADQVERAVAGALATVVMAAAPSHNLSVNLMVSTASQVCAGIPVDDGHGTYGCLASRIGSLRRHIAAASGADIALEFVHDATAAASCAGSANSATIVVGTWLGAGFQPAAGPPLLKLSPSLRVTAANGGS